MSKLFSKRLAVLLLAGITTGCTMTSCRPATPTNIKETKEPKESSMQKEVSSESGSSSIEIETTPTPPESETPPISTETMRFETEPIETAPSPILISEINLAFHSVTLGTESTISPKATFSPLDAGDHTLLWESSDPSVAQADQNGTITAVGKGQCTITVTAAGNPEATAAISVTVEDSPACTYIDGILIANKTYALPSTYAFGVDADAYNSLLAMITDAGNQGISLWLVSGYRSYWDQNQIYNNYVARDGQAEADRYSARPGHSEHQSGLAFDLNSLYQSFGDTAEGRWLAENCHKYGFIIRYPQNKEHITGYMYEPWHVRYIGTETAWKVHESGLCLEEYFGITSAYAN